MVKDIRLLSFDIEISDIFDAKPGEDFEKYAPFHVAVASTAILGGEERLWYSDGGNEEPLLNMTPGKADELLRYLAEMEDEGYMVSAWNGLGFDLRWIGYTAEDVELAAKIALKSYDPMFQFFNQRGFPVGLASVAQAMGIEQKKLMSGADAPKEWQAGNCQKVMDYVLGDSQMTNQIVAAILERREVRWITQTGQARAEPMPKLKTVEEVLRDPEPDQSWMDKPLLRSKFTKWIPDHLLDA